MQWAIDGGEPLYPCPASLLFSATMIAKYCRLLHVEKMGASMWHAAYHWASCRCIWLNIPSCVFC
jgi:hypothetical protein